MIDLIKNLSKIDQFQIEIAIADSIKIIGIRIDVNRRLNSDFGFDSTTMIRFATPNGISLDPMKAACKINE